MRHRRGVDKIHLVFEQLIINEYSDFQKNSGIYINRFRGLNELINLILA